jgi:hypothetical protein
MNRASAVVLISSANAVIEIATTESVSALYFQCECLWGTQIASGSSTVLVDGEPGCSTIIPFVVRQTALEKIAVTKALRTMQSRTDAPARGVALDALRTLGQLPLQISAGDRADILRDGTGISALVAELVPSQLPPRRSLRNIDPKAAASPPIPPYAGSAPAATLDLVCVLEGDKFKLVCPGQSDNSSKPVFIRLMGVEGGCDCGILEILDKKAKKKKHKTTTFPVDILDLKSCLALDISNTPKQADCIKLTFDGKGTYMLIAPLDVLRDWVEALREQWKGGSQNRATEEYLLDNDARYANAILMLRDPVPPVVTPKNDRGVLRD